MCGYEVLNDARQIILLGYLQAIGDVRYDDARARLGIQTGVGIDARLVFGEEDGVFHLANVVIEGTGTHQLALRAYLVGYLRGQVAHCYAVLEGARSLLAELAQEGVVGVRQLEEGHRRDKSKGLFYDQHERISKQKEEAIDRKVEVHGVVQAGDIVALNELQGQITDGRSHSYEQRSEEYLASLGQFAQGIDGHQACNKLHNDELILIFHCYGADEYHRGMGDKGRARVEEHPDEDRHHGKRKNVNA